MIKSFRHKGIENFFTTGKKSRINAMHAPKLRRQLAQLNMSTEPLHMQMPGWNLHQLTGPLKGHWAVWVSGNWRLTFTFENKDAVLVDYQDYH
jgi:proteic killer suppression protein